MRCNYEATSSQRIRRLYNWMLWDVDITKNQTFLLLHRIASVTTRGNPYRIPNCLVGISIAQYLAAVNDHAPSALVARKIGKLVLAPELSVDLFDVTSLLRLETMEQTWCCPKALGGVGCRLNLSRVTSSPSHRSITTIFSTSRQ
jgi:hypothetical protein